MFYLLLVSLLWAFSFGLIKTNLSSINPILISTIRLAVALLVFLPFLRAKGLTKQNWIRLLLIGAVQYGLMYIFYNFAFRHIKAFEVALFTIFTPIYVTLINDAIKRKLNLAHLMLSIITILGTAFIVKTSFSRPDMLVGFTLVQLSNLCFAIGQVFYKHLMSTIPVVKDQHIFAILYLGGAGITAILSIIIVPLGAVTITPVQVWTLLYLGAIASGLGFFLWNFGARRTNVGALAIFNNLKIPLSITVSLLVFGENTNIPALLMGGAIILAALVINEFIEKRNSARISAIPTN